MIGSTISCGALIGLAALAFIADRILASHPDCQIEILEKDCSNFTYVNKGNNEYLLTFEGKVKNLSSSEQAIITDASVTVEPGDIWHGAEIWNQVKNISLDSSFSNYWEAFMLKPKGTLSYQAHTLIKGVNQLFPTSNPIRLSLTFHYYGKNPIKCKRVDLLIPGSLWKEESFSNNTAAAKNIKPEESASHTTMSKVPPTVGPPPSAGLPRVGEVVPIRTRLLRPGDDMAEIIETYVLPLAVPGDTVAIAETALAITQGRLKHVLDINPGFWARRLNKLFHFNSSLGSVYSMQMAIQEVGVTRILMGILGGAVGRLLGRRGDFYRIAGRQAATIDDCAGTMPPFDKFVVMGPEAPKSTARRLKQLTGLEVAIVDVNDLKRVDILGASDGINPSAITNALLDNPQGNANEQTPLVLIKKEALSS